MSERRSSSDESTAGSGASWDGDEQHPTGDGIAEAVVEATAEATGMDPLTMEPLYDVVDPDALEALVGGPADDANVMVTFDFEGCRIAVQRGGHIEVEEL